MESEDRLAPARGCVIGVAIGAVVWAIFAWIVYFTLS